MTQRNDGFIYDDKIIYGYKYMNIDFIEPDKNCNQCDSINDYCCFECEHEQVKNKNLNSKYTDGCEWIVPIENRKDKHESTTKG